MENTNKEKVVAVATVEEATNIKQVTMDLIESFLAKRTAEEILWFLNLSKEVRTGTRTYKATGKVVAYNGRTTFIEIRNAFAKKYFPALIKEAEKSIPVDERLQALYNKKVAAL